MDELDDLSSLGKQMDEDPRRSLDLAAKYLHVRGRDGKPQWLVANAAQQEFERLRSKQNIVLKARQMGMTTWVAGRFFLRTIAYPGTLTVQVAHTQAAVEAIFRVVQRMWEHLPDPWRKGPLRRSRANVGQMVFPEIDSEFRVWSAADINAGRGLSMQNLHCSEVSRWPGDAAATLAGLRAALAPDGELVLESTPNGASGAFYNEWRAAELTQHFLPWWLEPAFVDKPVAEDRWTEVEQALVKQHNLTPKHIGYRRRLEREYGKLRTQEFAEDADTCFRATGDCMFEIEVVEQRMLEAPEPYKRSRNGTLLQWSKPQRDSQYIVAADTAGGGSRGDFCAVQVIDLKTGIQAAELQQRLRPQELADVVVELSDKYNDAVVAVERNNHGHAVLAYLKERITGKRMYRQDGKRGWNTTADSREKMLDSLNVMMSTESNCFMSQRLLNECRTFVRRNEGKDEAAGGSYDDLVMAMAIAQAVREEKLGRK